MASTSFDQLLFLSAQPGDYFFTWQIELPLYNFSRVGTSPENIHVLDGAARSGSAVSKLVLLVLQDG